MSHNSVLVISDNKKILGAIDEIIGNDPVLTEGRTYDYACHEQNAAMVNKRLGSRIITPLNIKKDFDKVVGSHDLVISAHCKQIFPKELVEKVRCVNIHPGLNPYNRGWFPQVFSILNKKPLGATIHLIDAELDHGDIIDQAEVPLEPFDTSLTAYNRVVDKEIDLIAKNLRKIVSGEFEAAKPIGEGNVNYRSDYDKLLELPVSETATYMEVIDRLRALSHPPYNNAFFRDPVSGKKIYVKVELTHEDDEKQ